MRALIDALRNDRTPAKPGFNLHVVHLSGARAAAHSGAAAASAGRWVGRRGPPRAPLAGRSAAPPPPVRADADLLPELAAAKVEGLALSVETCPHYLNFASEEVPEGDTR